MLHYLSRKHWHQEAKITKPDAEGDGKQKDCDVCSPPALDYIMSASWSTQTKITKPAELHITLNGVMLPSAG